MFIVIVIMDPFPSILFTVNVDRGFLENNSGKMTVQK